MIEKQHYIINIVLFLFLALSFDASSQCVPGNYQKPSIYPDTLTNLDTAYANKPYQMVMTAVIPVDTFVFGNRLPIDSIGIVSLTGLPPSMSYKSDKASGYWAGGTKGCILISGSPKDEETGIYPLNIVVSAVVAGLPANYPVKGYKIIVIGKGSSITDLPLLYDLKIYPNPVIDVASLRFFSQTNDFCRLTIYNCFGQIIVNQNHLCNYGENQLIVHAEHLNKGIYFLRITMHDSITNFVFTKN